MSDVPRTRRTLLRRSLFFAGGVLGLGLAGKAGVEAVTDGSAGRETKLTRALRGENWRLVSPERQRGVLPQPGERSSSFGQLFRGEGDKLGEFYASSFQFGSPFGASAVSAGAMETHTFNLLDGTLIGVGTLPDHLGSESVHAIIGGTGRYEGASGSYTARQRPVELGGDGTAEFSFTITLRSA